MAYYFLSDLHIDAMANDLHQPLIKWLSSCQQGDKIYCLGDLFDAWPGPEVIDNPAVQHILNAFLQATARGVSWWFIPGNRDVLVMPAVIHAYGGRYIREAMVIDCYARPTLLMHGDQLCTLDKSYQRWASMVKRVWVKKIFLAIPWRIRYALIQSIRKTTRACVRQKHAATMDVSCETVNDTMREYKVCQMIHGHTHKPAIHQEIMGRRIVLPSWDDVPWGVYEYTKSHQWVLVTPVQ